MRSDLVTLFPRVRVPPLAVDLVGSGRFDLAQDGASQHLPADLLPGSGRIVTLPTLLFAKISSSTLDASAAGLALLVSLPGIVLLIVSDRFIREEAFGKGLGS